jgi:hypothetical protein
MSATRRPLLSAAALAVVLTGAMTGRAQASLSELFHRANHSRHTGKIVHSSTPQHPAPLLRSARQSKVKLVLANTRTTARTLALKRQPPR